MRAMIYKRIPVDAVKMSFSFCQFLTFFLLHSILCPRSTPKSNQYSQQNKPLNSDAGRIVTLTKTDILEKISEDGLSKKEASDVLEALLDIMKKTLEAGEDLMISGFGKFSVKEKSKRRGRNPATGEELYLDARRVVTFQSSGVLRDRLNGEG